MNWLDVVYGFGGVVLSPIWARKARGGWGSRFGRGAELPAPQAGRPRVLLHAVSVGEVNALRGLVPMLGERVEVVVATTTDTGLARARALFEQTGQARVLRYPLDFSASVRRFLDGVRPSAVGLVELEVWPNFVGECVRRGIHVGVINGRLSERSFRGYRRIRPIIGRSFASLAFAAVQDGAYAERFAAMGVPPERLSVTDSMKWDSVGLEDRVEGSERLAQAMGIDRARPLVVAGSTAEDEEALLHACCPAGVQLLCAPRKPERFDEAARAMPGCVRRSRANGPGGDSGATGTPRADRFLLDTIGELRAAYALADVVVLGRSFGRLFGSDPVEPAALGKPVLMGPRYRDFDSATRALAEAGGLRLVTREELGGAIEELLRDPAARRAMGAAARACVAGRRGATARHAELLWRAAGVGAGG